GHPLAAQDSVAVEDLNGLPFVAFDADIPTRHLIDDVLRAHGTAVCVVHAFDNIETIKRVVEIGLGVAIVPEPTVSREVRDGTLLARPIAGESLTRDTGILLRKGRIISGGLSRFLDVLRGLEPDSKTTLLDAL
ncbi:MAG: LysR family transcriptional regulator substrate-binding protein, partial [Armatimonadota bacterium]